MSIKEGQETNGHKPEKEHHEKEDFTESGNSPPNGTRKPLRKTDRGEHADTSFSTLMSVEEVAKMMGISENTVYSWVHQRKLSFYKMGRLVRFRYGEVLRWIAKQKVSEYET